MVSVSDLADAVIEARDSWAHGETKLLASVLDQWPTSVLITDRTGKIVYVNPAFTEITGYSYEEAIGRNPKILKSGFHPVQFYQHLWATLLSGKKWSGAFRNRKKDGELYWEYELIAPVKGQKGEVTHFISVRIEDTERQEIEEFKNELIAVAAHELKTPLSVVREGIAEVVEGLLGETTQEQRRVLKLSLKGVDCLTHLIENILDLSGIESQHKELEREVVNLLKLAKGVKENFGDSARKRGLEIRLVAPEGGVLCSVDRGRMVQVFTNLVGNALKFTDRGHIEIALADKGHEVECSVSDTGRGILPEHLPRLFGKFQKFGPPPSGGERGTGLGLSIVKRIIELHHGLIWAESRVGQGTRFTFIIPKSPVQEGARVEAETRAPAPERPEANQASAEKETARHPIPGRRKQLDDLIYELSKAEEEEEVDLYLLRLHLDNDVDLRFFKAKEREEIKKQLSFLINETARHRELLAAAIEEMRQKRGSDAR